jgi:hypothetical protein
MVGFVGASRGNAEAPITNTFETSQCCRYVLTTLLEGVIDHNRAAMQVAGRIGRDLIAARFSARTATASATAWNPARNGHVRHRLTDSRRDLLGKRGHLLLMFRPVDGRS